jgi:hypothetical protein
MGQVIAANAIDSPYRKPVVAAGDFDGWNGQGWNNKTHESAPMVVRGVL